MRWLDDRRVSEALRGRSGRIISAHALGTLEALLWLAILALAGWLIGLGASRPSTLIWPPWAQTPRRLDPRGVLALGVALWLLLLLAAAGVGQARRATVAGLVAQLTTALRNQTHRQIYRQGQSALPTEGISPAVELFATDVDAIRDGIRARLDGAWRWPLLAVGLAGFALWLDGRLALFLMALAGLAAMAALASRRLSTVAIDAARREAELRFGLLEEDLGLVRTVRVFGMEGMDKRRFDQHLEDHAASDHRRLMAEGAPAARLLLIAGIAAAVGLGMVAHDLLIERVEVGRALLLLACLAGLAVPWIGWSRMRARMAGARRAATSVGRFLDRRPELLQNAAAKFLAPLREQISFENVTVEGPSGRTLLEGVTLQVPARTRTAVMGRDEDSKHALACLIPRLLDPKVGRVRIDGLDLRDVTLDSLRAQVATVLQSDLVFSDTVAANIGLGDPSYDLPRIVEAAKAAHAHHFIQDLDGGYDTYIGPMGQFLRLDELYRIALARAFLHDPSIVVIEESSGGFEDEEIKHLIDDAVNRLAQGRTVIFLPHRLSTIRACQQVVVLHNGRIEAVGAPKTLQSESKIYRHLQYVEFNQFAAGEIEAGQMGE